MLREEFKCQTNDWGNSPVFVQKAPPAGPAARPHPSNLHTGQSLSEVGLATTDKTTDYIVSHAKGS